MKNNRMNSVKKAFAIALVMCLCFSMCACGASGSDSEENTNPITFEVINNVDGVIKTMMGTWVINGLDTGAGGMNMAGEEGLLGVGDVFSITIYQSDISEKNLESVAVNFKVADGQDVSYEVATVEIPDPEFGQTYKYVLNYENMEFSLVPAE